MDDKTPTRTPPHNPGINHTTKAKARKHKSWGSMARPAKVLSSLLMLQTVEDRKPRLSKISWFVDVLVYHSSIIPVVLVPVACITLFSVAVAVAHMVYGKTIGLSNNVVPLLSVVVGLLLVFRNSTAYERYAEGRKDFTTLVSNSRNLARSIWVNVIPPPGSNGRTFSEFDRVELTSTKRDLVRMVVAFVVATKHHLRAEGGVHHADLKGLLPEALVKYVNGPPVPAPFGDTVGDLTDVPRVNSPRSYSGINDDLANAREEEHNVGFGLGRPSRPMSMAGSSPPPTLPTPRKKSHSFSFRPRSPRDASSNATSWITGSKRPSPIRRPTAVRVRGTTPGMAEKDRPQSRSTLSLHSASTSSTLVSERTPLIKTGVKPDIRRTREDVDRDVQTPGLADEGLGRMIEVGLPLVVAHEISRTLFRLRRQGCFENIGPAGYNGLQSLVQSMTDQLGSMERIQTPLPYVFCVHLKQCITLYLLCLPFVLVESLGYKMIWIVTATAFTLCGVEGIAAQIEDPFGTDPCDLNLDLFCTELLCECEAIIERFPEGDADEDFVFTRSDFQIQIDEEDGE